MIFERDKWYLTRDGKKVRVVCVDSENPKYPVIGLRDDAGVQWAHEYSIDGSFYHKEDDEGEHRGDLVSEYVEPPKPREFWIFLHGNHVGGAYTEDVRKLSLIEDPAFVANLVLFREVIE